MVANMNDAQTADFDVPTLVQEAHERTKDYLVPTPLEFSRYLSDLIDGEVWLKLDLMLRTAWFKYRGALSKILSLTEEEIDRGVVSASTGNYALAVAEAMRQRGRRATIYVAKDMDESRLSILRSHNLDLVIHGDGPWDAELEARRVGEEEGKIYVSPYNDPAVVGGQGTCGHEIWEQLPDVEAALFACGSGGLMTGSAGWLKYKNPDIKAYGVSPANSPVMAECIKADKMITMDVEPTLADTCAGNIDLDTITLEFARRHIDDMFLLTEDEIAGAVRLLFEQHRLVSEGSGALGVGGLVKHKELFNGKKVVAVVCGRNIDLEIFRKIIA
jgi:threonine dehydratase